MSDKDLDFEAQYESGLCQCADEPLEYTWDEDKLSFTAECSCMKRHGLKPLTCAIEVIEE